MRPLIGIPCHASFRAETGRPIYGNNRSYVHALEVAGGVPVLIPMLNDFTALDPLLACLDGLLLPGGVDMQPSRYGEEKHPLTEEADPQLDQFELIELRIGLFCEWVLFFPITRRLHIYATWKQQSIQAGE